MLRSLQGTKRSTKRVHTIALSSIAPSGEVPAVAGTLLSGHEATISEG
ncbi:hypothetical protein [Bradyrhizobium sp. SYSU BS000235]